MLDRSFIHLPGVGRAREKQIWQSGIRTWEEFLHTPEKERPVQISPEALDLLKQSVDHKSDLSFFARRMPQSEQWRLFKDFRHQVSCLDIETNGQKSPESITSVCTFDGKRIRVYIRNENLMDAKEDLLNIPILITFFGKQFDVPMIQSNLGVHMTEVHLDLFAIFRSLNVRGGLKKIEERFGINRGGLEGVDGYYAVLFWRYFRNTGDREALETLLSYNVEDTVNLFTLAHIAYNMKIEELGFSDQKISVPDLDFVESPYRPSVRIVKLARDFVNGVRY